MVCRARQKPWRLKIAAKGLAATKSAFADSPLPLLPASLPRVVGRVPEAGLGGGTPLAAIFPQRGHGSRQQLLGAQHLHD